MINNFFDDSRHNVLKVIVDEEGYILDYISVPKNEKYEYPVVSPYNGEEYLAKPKYSKERKQWVEGESEEEKNEREEVELLNALNPTDEEIMEAELEIKILTLLTELEVV